MKKTIIAITAAALVAAMPLTSPGTGIPVIDVSAIAQEIKQGLTQLQQYSTQLSAYQTQLLQFKNQVLNTTGIAQAQQIWQQSQQSINQVLSLTGVLQSSTGLQGQLGQFQNVNYWLNSAQLYTYQTAGSTAQKTANDAMVNSIVKQQQQITQDAAKLQALQTQAGSADGQMKALTAGNELAALQQQQLLQVRALLVSEQQAMAARNSTQASSEAQRQAASKQFFSGTLTTEPATGFHP